MSAPRKTYFENVKIGDELSPLAKPAIDRAAIARFAGASDDYNPLHVDDDYAKRSGFPGAFAQGTLGLSWLAELVNAYLRGGQLRRISSRFVKIVWPGDAITCRGRVADKRRARGEYFVDLDLWAENDKGELVMKGSATGKIYYSFEDEERQARGLSPLVIEESPAPTLADVFEREIRMAKSHDAGKTSKPRSVEAKVSKPQKRANSRVKPKKH